MTATDDKSPLQVYHSIRADLQPGDLIEPGYNSNYGKRKKAAYVYLTGTLDAAIWGGRTGRWGWARQNLYTVEPTGPVTDDPNLTDKKFPGNPTKSFRCKATLRVVGEITDWTGHSAERLKEMKDHLAELKRRGVGAIED
jgi:hypothetical protein